MKQKAPKSMRLHIGIFGRTNVGKSSLLNMIAGQNTALVSPIAGTTTDAVEKTMELLPVGPVVFIDTAGIDDKSEIGELRVKKTEKIFEKTEIALIVAQAGIWGDWEENLLREFKKRKIPALVIFNKEDLIDNKEEFAERISKQNFKYIFTSACDSKKRDNTLEEIKKFIKDSLGENKEKTILSHLISENGTAIFIIPIDKEAPKGRIILPQVMAIRDLLDANKTSICITEKEWPSVLKKLSIKPDLVVCDSQVSDYMVKNAPKELKCTTFSIIFSGFKGDMAEFARGAARLEAVKPGDKIAILEACSHHPIEDDIGRIKLPKWLEKKAGGKLKIDVFAGREMPENLSNYDFLINCGGCMLTAKEMENRQNKSKEIALPMTNYGMAIGVCFGILERLLEPFPEVLNEYLKEIKANSSKLKSP